MRIKPSIIILVVVFVILVGEVCYLKVLPSSFVRVYYASDIKDFNKPPTEDMTVEMEGDTFNYYIPHEMERNILKVIKDLIEDKNPDVLDTLILIANWVRSEVKFGTPEYKSNNILVEDLLSDTRNVDIYVLCDSYARLFVIACQSQNIIARIVELEGHLVTEAFIREINKWIMIDPVYGYYISKNNEPLSVAEMIDCYGKGIPLTPYVFAENRGDDPLYREKDEVYLKKVYLNGYTVISDQNVDGKKIKDAILKTLRLPIAKIQFVEAKSTLIGYKEKILRYVIVITFAIFVIVLITAFSKGRENT